MKKRVKQEPDSLAESMARFFSGTLAERASSGLSEGACIALEVGGETYYFVRKKGKNALLHRSPGKAELRFIIPERTMRHLLTIAELPETGLGTMGIAIFEALLNPIADQKVRFQVESSFFTLLGKGYFSVLKAGGPEVASYMAKMGLGGLVQLKSLLLKIRG